MQGMTIDLAWTLPLDGAGGKPFAIRPLASRKKSSDGMITMTRQRVAVERELALARRCPPRRARRSCRSTRLIPASVCQVTTRLLNASA